MKEFVSLKHLTCKKFGQKLTILSHDYLCKYEKFICVNKQYLLLILSNSTLLLPLPVPPKFVPLPPVLVPPLPPKFVPLLPPKFVPLLPPKLDPLLPKFVPLPPPKLEPLPTKFVPLPPPKLDPLPPKFTPDPKMEPLPPKLEPLFPNPNPPELLPGLKYFYKVNISKYLFGGP